MAEPANIDFGRPVAVFVGWLESREAFSSYVESGFEAEYGPIDWSEKKVSATFHRNDEVLQAFQLSRLVGEASHRAMLRDVEAYQQPINTVIKLFGQDRWDWSAEVESPAVLLLGCYPVQGELELDVDNQRPRGALPVSDFGPLWHAVENGKLDEVKRLLHSGADPNEEVGPRGLPVLAIAKAPAVVQLLLDSGADPTLGAEGYTVFHGLVSGDRGLAGHFHTVDVAEITECARLLLAAGAPFESAAAVPAVVLAARHQYWGVVDALVAAGADPDGMDMQQLSARSLVLQAGRQSEVPSLAAPREPALGNPAWVFVDHERLEDWGKWLNARRLTMVSVAALQAVDDAEAVPLLSSAPLGLEMTEDGLHLALAQWAFRELQTTLQRCREAKVDPPRLAIQLDWFGDEVLALPRVCLWWSWDQRASPAGRTVQPSGPWAGKLERALKLLSLGAVVTYVEQGDEVALYVGLRTFDSDGGMREA